MIGVISILMYVIRFIEFIFRLEIEFYIILGYYYLWVFEIFLLFLRVEVRFLKLVVIIDFFIRKRKGSY